ncbi:YidC/Oxa1 family membrane protein insertase [Glycomyces sp. A-F 0318]|uniref:YidC/Oxa1 family membrane protein insertase n=1 Tax=Glycomyces amatae TaxID=2881355 RepID=UPI001E53943A|nr:YidC/Oxa1 family membrane protein insertase [Glycomyces amatae]
MPAPAAPGKSELGEGPFTRGIDSSLDRLRDALQSWGPFFDAMKTFFGWVVAPFALLVWITTPVALALAYGVEGTYTAISLIPAPPCTSMVLLAAVALLVLLRLLMLPMQLRGARSGANMSRLAPRVKALQERYKGDRGTLQKEMMELYRVERVNPMMSCLVVIVMVLFAAGAWRMLKGLAVKGENGMFNPDFLHEGSNLRDYLTGIDGIDSWGMNLLVSVGEVGFCQALVPYAVTHVVSIVLALIQTSFTIKAARRLPHAKGAYLALMCFGIGTLLFLPMFLVILKIVDSTQSWIQTTYIKRKVAGELRRLRDDQDIQRNVGENVADEILGRAARKPRPMPLDGDDLTAR